MGPPRVVTRLRAHMGRPVSWVVRFDTGTPALRLWPAHTTPLLSARVCTFVRADAREWDVDSTSSRCNMGGLTLNSFSFDGLTKLLVRRMCEREYRFLLHYLLSIKISNDPSTGIFRLMKWKGVHQTTMGWLTKPVLFPRPLPLGSYRRRIFIL